MVREAVGRDRLGNIEEEVARLERANQNGTFEYERALLFQWFRKEIENYSLTPLGYRAGTERHPLAEEVESQLKRRGLIKKGPLDEFNKADYRNFKLGDVYVTELIRMLHEIPSVANFPERRARWEAVQKRMNRRVQRFRDRIAANRRTTDFKDSPLQEDYLLFRRDANKTVSAAFLRFFDHDTGGTRFMGMRLDQKHSYLSSKGWLVKQPTAALVVNYIVNREDPQGTVHHAGGASVLWIATSTNKGARQRNGVIEVAPVLHFQSVHEHEATCAQAVLVRCKGLEQRVRDAKTTEHERALQLRELQEDIAAVFGRDYSIAEASKMLSRATGIAVRHFLNYFNGKMDPEEAQPCSLMGLRPLPIGGRQGPNGQKGTAPLALSYQDEKKALAEANGNPGRLPRPRVRKGKTSVAKLPLRPDLKN